MDSHIGSLQQEYCPPLDTALFAALVSDYDLGREDSVSRLRETLDALKEDAQRQDSWECDAARSAESLLAPTATSSSRDVVDHKRRCRSPGLGREPSSTSGDTDLTSISEAMWSLNMEDGFGIGAEEHQRDDASSAMDVPSKQAQLTEAFPDLQDAVVAQALKDANGDYDKAIDLLLNQVFIEQDDEEAIQDVPKGVDGFAAPEEWERGRKRPKSAKKRRRSDNGGKGKGRNPEHAAEQRARSASLAKSDIVQDSPQNVWHTVSKDVEFLSSRLGLPQSTITSIYHDGHASLAATLRAILDMQGDDPDDMTSKGAALDAKAFELEQIYPTIPSRHIRALVRLTDPSMDAAYELAEKLYLSPEPSAPEGGIEVVTLLPEIKLSPASPVKRRGSGVVPTTSATEAAEQAAYHRQEAQKLQSQAAAARRRGTSNHLRHGEAGYYSAQIREHENKARQYDRVAADALVAHQSTDAQLDLHGVTVQEAVRIARESVGAWWSGLGEARFDHRARQARAYRVVTGVGKHSPDGRGRIGPAVAKMLIRDGWRVQIGHGFLIVTGLARR